MRGKPVYNYMESDEYGRERYGPYTTDAEAEAGYFRLLVSAVIGYRDDNIDRCVYGAGGADAFASDHDDALWTAEYKDWLYGLSTDDVLAEARRDEEGEPSVFVPSAPEEAPRA